MNAADLAIGFVYASLLVELLAFPIPSEASVWQLLAAKDGGAVAGPLRTAQRQGRLAKLLRYALPTTVGVVAWLLPGLCLLWPALRLGAAAPSPATAAAGMVAIGLGRGLTFTSVLQLRHAQRLGRPPEGWFRWSRNPGLVGMYLCFGGLVLAAGLPLLWAALPLYVANMHGRVRLEEAHQQAQLGPAWANYAAAVPRYLPLPGLR